MKTKALTYAIYTSVVALVLSAPVTMSARKKDDAKKPKAADALLTNQSASPLGTIEAKGESDPDGVRKNIDILLAQYGGGKKKAPPTRPLKDLSAQFVSRGKQYGVDPRLIVAIAGAESTFGEHICTTNNAWNWFYSGHCTSPFQSWESGMQTVTKFMRKSYILHGYDTIEKIGKRYCASGCEHWPSNVRNFYTSLGADPNVIAWTPQAPALAAPPKATMAAEKKPSPAAATTVTATTPKTSAHTHRAAAPPAPATSDAPIALIVPPSETPTAPPAPPTARTEPLPVVPTVSARVDRVDIPTRNWRGSLTSTPTMTVTALVVGTTAPESVKAVVVADGRRTEVAKLELSSATASARVYSGTVSLAGFTGPLQVEVQTTVAQASGWPTVMSAGIAKIDVPPPNVPPSRWFWIALMTVAGLSASSIVLFRMTRKQPTLQLHKSAA
jgi:hypothetical protein